MRDAGQDGGRTGGIQDREYMRNAGHEEVIKWSHLFRKNFAKTKLFANHFSLLIRGLGGFNS